MKKKLITAIIIFLLIIGAIIAFIFINQPKGKFKYYKNDSNYQLYLENAKVGETIKYKLNKDYIIEYKFTKLVKEELSYDIYINNEKLISTKMIDFTNSEFDTDDFYLYGKTLVYFSDNLYDKDSLDMYIINDTNFKKVKTEYGDIKGLRLSSYLAEKDNLTIIASRRNNNDTFTYGEITFNICEEMWPEGFTNDTIVEAHYQFKMKDNKLDETPTLVTEYTYKEYLTEGDEIVCE